MAAMADSNSGAASSSSGESDRIANLQDSVKRIEVCFTGGYCSVSLCKRRISCSVQQKLRVLAKSSVSYHGNLRRFVDAQELLLDGNIFV